MTAVMSQQCLPEMIKDIPPGHVKDMVLRLNGHTDRSAQTKLIYCIKFSIFPSTLFYKIVEWETVFLLRFPRVIGLYCYFPVFQDQQNPSEKSVLCNWCIKERHTWCTV